MVEFVVVLVGAECVYIYLSIYLYTYLYIYLVVEFVVVLVEAECVLSRVEQVDEPSAQESVLVEVA